MEPEARYTLIGSVLLALLVGAIAAFVWLSSSGSKSDFQFYTVYFERQSLEGLQIGADVNMRGVKVGRVEDYTIERENINRVAMTLRVTRTMPVSENTSAVVARNLVTGIARINLETPGKPGPQLVAIPPGERYPVIAEGTSNLDQIADSVGRLAVQTDQALHGINQALGSVNQDNLAQTLAAMSELTKGLNKRLVEIDAASGSIKTTSAEFQKASRAFTTAMQSLSSTLPTLSDEAGNTLREARQSMSTVSESGRNLEKSMAGTLQTIDRELVTVVRKTEDAVDVSVHELRSTAQDLRSSIELVSRALDRLQDPKAALLGPSAQQYGPGEAPTR